LGTHGRDLLEGKSELKIFGQVLPVKAKIENISGLSAHADSQEIIRWLKESKLRQPKVFLTHGEPTSAEALAKKLRAIFKWQIEIAKDGEEVEL